LLATCSDHDIGVKVLTWLAQEPALRINALDHKILALAAAYNGQGSAAWNRGPRCQQ